MQQPTIGRIVEFFPNGSDAHLLPNQMESAPAIVVQVFEKHVNLNLFTATQREPVQVAWSICHKDDAEPGVPFWDWPQRN